MISGVRARVFIVAMLFGSSSTHDKDKDIFRPCTDLTPIDLIKEAVPTIQDLPDGVSVTYDPESHVHAFGFSNEAHELQFPSKNIFKRCNIFPEEFSFFFVYQYKVKPARRECLLSLVDKETNSDVISVSFSKTRILFRYQNQTIKFKSSILNDSYWHTIGFSVSGKNVAMTIDCRMEKSKKLRRQFPALLSVNNRIFSIARCHSKQTIFQGLLKDIILVPGADAAVRACPPRPPPYNEMDNRIPMVPESPMTSYWPRGSECTWLDVGNLAFDVYTQKIKVCVNGIWQEVTVETEKRRLDYTLEYQTLTTPSASIDVTVFHLPGEGMFAAFANNGGGEDSSGHSVVFKWVDGRFEFYQKLSTESAQSCEYFQIRNQFFLAVANYGNSTSKQNNSTIFRWHRRRKKFKPYQEILTWTARDFEYFEIDGDHYLAVANHAEGDSNDVESSIYQWNKGKKRFEEKQTIPTIGAYDWTHFTVDGFHFLVVANAFNGLTTLVYSVIYFWQNDQLVQFQTMETNGATDVEWFTIDGDIFLAIANAFNYGPQNYLDKDTQFTNSTIYKLNKDKKIFEKYQSIPTYSAIDWEYFQVGPDHYLIVSNAQNGGSPDQHTSIIYRWQGMEKFVAVHRLITPATADWEIFTDKKDVYLIYANAKDTTSQVLKVKFV